MVKMEAQLISEADLQRILKLHQCRLGWSHLLESTIADRAVGFPCENEEFLIRRELKKIVHKVSEWFKVMTRQNNWPSLDGWMWEVDFESSQAVPKKQQTDKTKSDEKNSVTIKLTEGPIMALGDMMQIS